MEKTILLTLGLLALTIHIHKLEARGATNKLNPIENYNHKRVRLTRSLSSDSICSGRTDDSRYGRCMDARDCVEAFEAPATTCNNIRGAVCCYDRAFNTSCSERAKSVDASRYKSKKKITFNSSARGLEAPSEPISTAIPNLKIPEESSHSKTKMIGYPMEQQQSQFVEAMKAISEDIEMSKTTKDGTSKQQLLDINVDIASRYLQDYGGYSDTRLIKSVRYLDAIHEYLSKKSNVSFGPLIQNKPPKLSQYNLNFICLPEPECDHEAHYRTIDGSCNNLEYPLLGRSRTGYDRLMLPNYDDHFQALRENDLRGNPLPGAREVSLVSFGTLDGQSRVMSQMGVFFAQFIAHDMSSAAMEELSTDPLSPVDCCKGNNNNVACAPIKVPKLDPHYGLFRKCLNFVRTVQAPPAASSCVLGPRQQLNKVTHWLDLSVIYGDNLENLKNLRDPHNSALLVASSKRSDQQDVDGPYMPNDITGFTNVGDKRANQTPMLSVLQIVFWRLHNKLAVALAKINPHWSGERLFQEARRINIAIYQSIVYKEFLPILVGGQVLKQFNTDLTSKHNHTEVYQANLKYGAALNEFAHGAYRLHNIVWGLFQTQSDSGKLTRVPTPLWLVFQKGQMVCKRNVFKGTLNSMLLDEGGKWDSNMPDDIHGRLFQTTLQLVGHDLLSLDIQRGRDHGLPSYVKVRQACGLATIRSWSQLDGVLQFGAGIKLRLVYENPQDIDLVVGGQLELPMEGAVVGPTFACLIAEQMRRTRFGDRYFFDNKLQPYPFTVEQLTKIKSQPSMASVLCYTTTLNQAQPNVFGVISQQLETANGRRDCREYPFLELEAWRETSQATHHNSRHSVPLNRSGRRFLDYEGGAAADYQFKK